MLRAKRTTRLRIIFDKILQKTQNWVQLGSEWALGTVQLATKPNLVNETSLGQSAQADKIFGTLKLCHTYTSILSFVSLTIIFHVHKLSNFYLAFKVKHFIHLFPLLYQIRLPKLQILSTQWFFTWFIRFYEIKA